MSAASDELMKEILGDRDAAGGSRTPTYKVPGDGKEHAIRILPGFFGKSKQRWYEPIVQHWGPVPDGRGYNTSFPCVKEHFGKKCPYCEALEEARAKEKELDESLAHCDDDDSAARLNKKLAKIKTMIKELLPRRAYAHNIVDRDEETPTTRVFFAPKTVWDAFVGAYTNNSDGDIFDESAGHDFVLTRKTVNRRTEYKAALKVKSTPVHRDEDTLKRLLEARIDLPKEYIVMPDLEVMRQSVAMVISGQAKKREFAEEDVGPRRSRDESDKTRRPRDEDDSQADKPRRPRDEDDSQADKPRRPRDDDPQEAKPRKKAPPTVIDDDDDPIPMGDAPRTASRAVILDDDDDDDDPKPSKAKRDALLDRFNDDDD